MSFRTIEISDGTYEHDGLRFLTVKTPSLAGRGDICIYVPDGAADMTDLPIYILLHGVYGGAWAWALKGGAHHTARRLISGQQIRPAVVAMPSDGLWGDGSAYFTHHGKAFDRWIVEDVPQVIRQTISGTSANSPLCIGGLSMGGYGALALGARFSDRFSAISGHSSMTRLAQMADFAEEPLTAYLDHCPQPDLIDMIVQHRDQLPALRFDCGAADPLLEANRALHQQLAEAGISHRYEEFPGGHEWAYWQAQLERTFLFFDQYSRLSPKANKM